MIEKIKEDEKVVRKIKGFIITWKDISFFLIGVCISAFICILMVI